MRKVLFLMLLMLAAIGGERVYGAGFNIEEINVSETARPKPFTISHVEQQGGELRLWIESRNISEVARLLIAGGFETQSTKGEEVITVPLSLWKAVSCKNIETSYLDYSAPIPAQCQFMQIRYYLRTPLILDAGRDFGIGLNPDFLWLVEKK